MKELLQSKLFRDNLKKWLFMYVGTILLLTSAITYSKYISNYNSNAEAIPAKFIIKLGYLDSNCTDNSIGCSKEISTPSNEYTFDFYVDMRELEVSTDIVITPLLAANNTKKAIYEIDEHGTIISDSLSQISYRYKIGDNKFKYYRIIVDHEITNSEQKLDITSNILTLGYSAEQIN